MFPQKQMKMEMKHLRYGAGIPLFNIYAMEQAEKIYQKDHPDFKLDIQENIYNDIETKLITAATSGDYSTFTGYFF